MKSWFHSDLVLMCQNKFSKKSILMELLKKFLHFDSIGKTVISLINSGIRDKWVGCTNYKIILQGYTNKNKELQLAKSVIWLAVSYRCQFLSNKSKLTKGISMENNY